MATPLDIILRVVNEDSVARSLRRVEADAKASDSRASSARRANVNAQVAHAEKAADRVRGKFGAAMTGAAGTLASYGLASLSSGLIAAGDEAEGAELKLRGMVRALGLPASSVAQIQDLSAEMAGLTGMDDDLFVNTSARLMSFGLNAKQIRDILPGLIGQARTMDQDLGSVADMFGKAYASGNAGMLKKSGVVLDQNAVDRISEMKKAGKYVEAQNATFDAVYQSLQKYALKASEGRSAAQIQRGTFNTQFGNFQEAVGQSAGRSRAAWQGALTPMLQSATQNTALTGALGAGLELGTLAAPVLTAAATIGQALPTFALAGSALAKVSTAVTSVGQAGPMIQAAYNASRVGNLTAAAAATFNGSANMAAAVRLRASGAIAATSLSSAAVALGAIAVTAYGIVKLREGMEAVKHGTDAELEANHGTWGKIWARGGRFVSDAQGRLSGETARGARLDAELKAMNAKRARGGGHVADGTVKVKLHYPASRADRAAAAY